MMRDIYTQNYI